MIEHTTCHCLVPLDALVVVDLGDGAPFVEVAQNLAWGLGAGPNGEGRILRYGVVNMPSASAQH